MSGTIIKVLPDEDTSDRCRNVNLLYYHEISWFMFGIPQSVIEIIKDKLLNFIFFLNHHVRFWGTAHWHSFYWSNTS